MLRPASLLVAFLCAIAAPTAASAGIYNPQSILATEADEGLSGAITGSADWRTGNVSYLFLSAGPVARYRDGDHLLIGIVTAEHRTSRGTKLLSRLFEHLRYRYSITDMVLGEVYAQHEYDAVKRLELRTLVGAGPRLQMIQADCAGLGIGLSYMLEYERLRDDSAADAGATDFQHRMSSYLTGHYELADRIQALQTVYVQPRLTDGGDTRILSDSRLVIQASKSVSFSTSFAVSYDRAPPANIEKVDTAMISSLTIEL